MRKNLSIALVISVITVLFSGFTSQAFVTNTRNAVLEADTYVMCRSGNAAMAYNYGGAPTLNASRLSNRTFPVVRFDMSGVPSDETITGAKLKLTIQAVPANAIVDDLKAQYFVGRFKSEADKADDWAEGDLNGTTPAAGAGIVGNDVGTSLKPPQTASFYWSDTYAAESVIEVDVSGMILNDIAGGKTKTSLWLGLYVNSLVEGKNVGDLKFYSEENSAAKAPKLELTTTKFSEDEIIINNDYHALTIPNAGFISRDVALPSTGVNGSPITWSSDNADFVTDAGIVHRPTDADSVTATLTATIGDVGGYHMTKSFPLTVWNIKYPEADVAFRRNSTFTPDGTGASFNVRGNGAYYMGFLRFDLPVIPDGYAVDTAKLILHQTNTAADTIAVNMVSGQWDEYAGTYTSCNDLYAGRVLSPKATADASAPGDIQIDVSELLMNLLLSGSESKISFVVSSESVLQNTMTFATREAASYKPQLIVTTKEVDPNELLAMQDMIAIDLGNLSNVAENISLPDTGSVNGSEISWASTNAAIAPDGTVTRPGINEENVSVTLSATVTKGSASVSKDFTATVLSKKYPAKDAMVQSGSGTNINYGDSASLAARYNKYRMAYLQFDLSGITSAVTSSRLVLTYMSTTRPADASTEKLAIVDGTNWDESQITYATKPEMGRTIAQGVFSSDGTALEFDITDYVGMLSTTENKKVTFAVYSNDTTLTNPDQADSFKSYYYYAKESTIGKPVITLSTEDNSSLLNLYKDMANISIPLNVKNNLTLPASLTNGTSVVWNTTDASHIAADGAVHRPDRFTSDAAVTLSASASNGSITGKTFTYAVVVPKNVTQVQSIIVNQNGTMVTDNLLHDGGTVEASVSISNDSDIENEVSAYAAVYADGKLVAVKKAGKTFTPGEISTISIPVGAVDSYMGTTFKIVTWSDMAPLRSAFIKAID